MTTSNTNLPRVNKYAAVERLPAKMTVFRTPNELKDGINDPNRRPGVIVTYQNYVAGTGGDLWICRHQDGSLGKYWATELEDVE